MSSTKRKYRAMTLHISLLNVTVVVSMTMTTSKNVLEYKRITINIPKHDSHCSLSDSSSASSTRM